ncbi:MAG TPA: acyltransferase [Candidatus Cybelea sp.]|nr:acyltransferase [Candidatus Cybelea sp.]
MAPHYPIAALGRLPLQDDGAAAGAPRSHAPLAAPRRLGDFDFRHNGIGFLRFFFASLVVWSHAFTLGGFGVDPLFALTKGAEDGGSVAVDCFFVLSGFLIARSFERTAHLGRYLWHRALRIFPGFWACLVVVAFGVAPILYAHERASLAGFLSPPNSPWTYLGSNAMLVMNQYNIAGLLANAPVPLLFNHSLWTLQYEFLCYLMVGALGTLVLATRRPAIFLVPLVVCFALFAAASWHLGLEPVRTPVRAFELYTFFAVGICAYAFRDRVPLRGSFALLSVLLIACTITTRAYVVVLPFALSYLTLYVAMVLPVRDFDRRCDLSYGIYIYAFPISQLLTALGAARVGFVGYFSAAYLISLWFAAASWFGIEKRFLALKNAALTSKLWDRVRVPLREGSSRAVLP